MYFEAFLSGLLAAGGSTLGKLSGSSTIVGDSYVLWLGLLIAMVIVNTLGCRHYLRALDAATNSAAPTVISAASSYVLSGLIGVTLFDEGATLTWWIGTMLIIIGLGLLARSGAKMEEKKDK